MADLDKLVADILALPLADRCTLAGELIRHGRPAMALAVLETTITELRRAEVRRG